MTIATSRSFGFAIAFVLTACGPLAGDGDGSGSSSGSETTATSDPVTTSPTTSATSTTTPGTTATTTSGDPATSDPTTTTSGVDSSGFIVTDDSEVGSEGGQPNGAECDDPSQCVSGFCSNSPGPGGGVCSECLEDADCGMGTCSFEFDVGYAVCTDGALGDGCDSDVGCMDALVCAPQFGDGGGFSPNHCSECNADTPCASGTCSPLYDGSPFQGYLHCVDAGTVANGDGCPIVAEDMGDGSVCTSGICGIASVMMGSVQIGICSDCATDDDCADGTTCDTAHFMMMAGAVPGTCV
jgi:hypothetical protein